MVRIRLPHHLFSGFLAARLCSKKTQKRPLQARDIQAILGNSSIGLGSSVHLASDQQDKQMHLIYILEKLFE